MNVANDANINPADGWEEQGGSLYKFETPGEIVEGVLKWVGRQPSSVSSLPDATYAQYLLATDDGNKLINAGANLEMKMALVRVGDLVKIMYEGEGETAAHRKIDLFKVWSMRVAEA